MTAGSPSPQPPHHKSQPILPSPARTTGFSLIELLLVLGVLAILLVAMFVIYPTVRRNMEIDQANKALSRSTATIRANMRGNYRGLNNTVAERMKAMPTQNGKNGYGPGDSAINVYTAPSWLAAGNRMFAIQLQNLPAEYCQGIFMPIASQAARAEMNSYAAKGVYTYLSTYSSGQGTGKDFDFADALAVCSHSNYVTLNFYFR